MSVKFSLVVGAAIACAVMTGCKATKVKTPKENAVVPTRSAQRTDVVSVGEQPAQQPEQQIVIVEEQPVQPIEVKPAPAKAPVVASCKCPPGIIHDSKCKCGAPNCKCKVKAPEPEYTLYRVKKGDMLSAICKTYGLRQKNVLALNPGLDPNKLYAGRKIKLPGKIEIKDAGAADASKPDSSVKGPVAAKQPASAKDAPAAAKSPAAKQPAAAKSPARASSYNGATKEYVVQSGDTVGKIAYAHGITASCLREMNGLKNNNIRIGKKLKVPAEKPVAEAKKDAPAKQPEGVAAAAAAPKAPAQEEAKPTAAPAVPAPAEPVAASPEDKSVESVPAVEQVKETAVALEPGEQAAKTHTVKEGEDIVSIAIMYNVSPSTIMDLNDLKNTDTLTPGQVLKLPSNAKMQ